MKVYIAAILSSYIVTLVIAGGSIMQPFRRWIMIRSPWLQIGDNPHPIVCRLCLGCWVSLVVVLAFGLGLAAWLPVYGASYFLATQERG